MRPNNKSKGLMAKLKQNTVNGEFNPEAANANPPAAPSAPADPNPAAPAAPAASAPAVPAAPAAPAAPAQPAAPADPAAPAAPQSSIPKRKLPGVEPAAPAAPAVPSGFDEEAFDKETKEISDGKEVPFKVFGDLRAELKKYRRGEVMPDPVKQKVEELEAKAARLAELETENEGLKTRVTKLAGTSAKAMVESHPVYSEKVEGPRAVIEETIKTIADMSDGKVTVEELQKLVKTSSLTDQNAMLDKLSNKLPILQLNRLVTCCNDSQTIRDIERKMMDNAEEFIAEQNRLKKERSESERSEKVTTVKKYGQQFFRDYLPHVPAFVEENGVLSDLGRQVEQDLAAFNPGAMSLEDDGYAVFASAAIGPIMEALNVEREARMKLEAELQRIGNRLPKVTDGQPNPRPSTQSEKGERKGLMAHMREQNFVGA